jgi:sugar/nucleoside kinase (ribokinase family)
MRLDYLVIGHVTKDLAPNGYTIGGTVTYSALTAQRLGRSVAIVTAGEDEFIAEVKVAAQGVALHHRSSQHTSTFENIYTDAGRTQYLRARADDLTLNDVPIEWRNARIVHLGPLTQELSTEMVTQFPNSLVALTPQGWLRQWDQTGRVSPQQWTNALEVLGHVDVLIFSPEDVGHHWETIRTYTRAAPLSVLTLERHGALVFQRDEGRWLAPREASVVDPTGAGDVFAAAFLVAYAEQRDPIAAARFANVTASFSIEGHGITNIPDHTKVLQWLAAHPTF